MFIETIRVGNNFTNCYIVGEEGRQGAVIDPGAEVAKILDVIEKKSVTITAIINTHGHFDHLGGNTELQEMTGAPVLIHRKEKDFLTDPRKNLSGLLGKGKEIRSPEAERLLTEGDEITCGSTAFRVLHTPGHSPGSISLYSRENNILFSGDTIFNMGVGRTDLPGSREQDLFRAIEKKILKLPENTRVFPGHGEETTIGQFKNHIWEQIRS